MDITAHQQLCLHTAFPTPTISLNFDEMRPIHFAITQLPPQTMRCETCYIKWDRAYGRPKKTHVRFVRGKGKMMECMIFHSVTAKDLDDSDLEAYDLFVTDFSSMLN